MQWPWVTSFLTPPAGILRVGTDTTRHPGGVPATAATTLNFRHLPTHTQARLAEKRIIAIAHMNVLGLP
jgi:acetylornithine deacetylase/succinyl-diaminopimelate desuccinylase-like protein